MSRLSILIFAASLCLALGWEPGTQYTYKYAGRSMTGIYHLKQQNAVVEIQSRVIVQSHDENTIVVKLSDAHIKRNGKYESNPYITGEVDESDINPVSRDEIDGQQDQISNPEHFGAPFVIKHKKGSIDSIEVGENEPLWVVNYKKAIASQLQLDVSGVRPDGQPIDWSAINKEETSATFQVLEDSITGDCSTTITVNRLPISSVYEHEVYDLPAFQTLCKDKPVYEVIKTKDFDRCKSTPVSYYAQPSSYLGSFEKAKFADFLQRTAFNKYIGCGTWPKLTYITLVSNNDVLVKPFATETESLTNTNAIRWSLEKKESISSKFSTPSSPKTHETLSHVFPEFEQDSDPTDSSFKQPALEEAYQKSPIPVQKLQQTIYETLRFVAKDLKDKPDSESDNLERLSVIGRALPMFSLEELRGLWQQVKKEDQLTVTLFVDAVVQSGSNPAIMLIKELIENKEVSETKATWAIAALGYSAKTPTTELLHELINLYKSSTVQSSKSIKQSALVMLADLFHAACGDFVSSKRFAPQLGDLCDKKDPVVQNEFIPLLVKELENSQSPVDKIVALTAFGSFGFEEIIPVLLPYIRGSQDLNDTAVRTRAVLSLHRVVYAAPEKVHPILVALASNSQERDEVRMAALGLLFSSNAPFAVWQKFASSSWFEESTQVVTFTRSLLKSISELSTEGAFSEELIEKAQHALRLTKPAPFGLPFSFFDIRSSYLDEGFGINMDTISFRVADEHWPVVLANRYFYQFGPFVSQPLTIFLWNYNMGEVWENVFGKLYGGMYATGSRGQQWNVRARGSSDNLVNSVWEDLSVSSRPNDKRVGLLHINLMGSINRFYDMEKLPEIIPGLMAQAMKVQSGGVGYEVAITKYRILAEYNIKFPTEVGLPLRFLSTLPIIASFQGSLKADGQNGIKSDVAAELSWKLASELRVDLPFNGNYIATGVDVRVESRLPKEMNYNFQNGVVKVTWTPGSKVTDLLYYHVKPYTITRNVADSYKPTLEDEKNYHIISVNDEPAHYELPLGNRYGVNLQVVSHSELDFTDFASWIQWFKKFDVNSVSNLAFVPLDIKHREYHLRYKPEGTKARSVQTWFQYQYAFKSCEHTVVFQSGEDQPTKRSSPEVISPIRPIAPEFQSAAQRVLKEIDSGNAQLLRAGFTIEQKDGSFIHFNSTLALAKDSWYTKDYTDLHVEKYTTTGPSVNANKKVDYAINYVAVRNWNKAPHYGFSKDVLYLTDDETITFGENGDQSSKIRFKAKVFRDEHAAKVALYSPVGQKCQKDMSKGFMYGSPACEEARYLDQTYNNYELTAEAENLPAPVGSFLNKLRNWINNVVYDYTVEHTYQPNSPNRATWNIKYDPTTGASNMTWVRPFETVVAHNVRFPEDYEPFSPLAYESFQALYPLNAGQNWARTTLNKTYGGASEDKCFVGPKAVYTYDGGFYNYTVDQCEHVLMTDCSQETKIAVLSRQEGQVKVVKVVYGNDTVELNPTGTVTINGVKTAVKSLDKDARFEIRSFNNKAIKAVVYPILDGIVMEIRSLNFFIKVQGSHVELTAPRHLRGKTCGLCGDYNQETTGEFKTPNRCAVSDGELMAASFKLTSGQGCSAKKDDSISRRLAKETEDCKPFDVQYPTHLPEVDLKQPTKCTRYEKLTYEGTYEKVKYESVEYSAKCQPGCKPYMVIEKPFTFKSSGAKDIVKKVPVPTTCIAA